MVGTRTSRMVQEAHPATELRVRGLGQEEASSPAAERACSSASHPRASEGKWRNRRRAAHLVGPEDEPQRQEGRAKFTIPVHSTGLENHA